MKKSIEELLTAIAETKATVWVKRSADFKEGFVYVAFDQIVEAPWANTSISDVVEHIFGKGVRHSGDVPVVIHPKHIPEGFADALKAFHEMSPDGNIHLPNFYPVDYRGQFRWQNSVPFTP